MGAFSGLSWYVFSRLPSPQRPSLACCADVRIMADLVSEVAPDSMMEDLRVCAAEGAFAVAVLILVSPPYTGPGQEGRLSRGSSTGGDWRPVNNSRF